MAANFMLADSGLGKRRADDECAVGRLCDKCARATTFNRAHQDDGNGFEVLALVAWRASLDRRIFARSFWS